MTIPPPPPGPRQSTPDPRTNKVRTAAAGAAALLLVAVVAAIAVSGDRTPSRDRPQPTASPSPSATDNESRISDPAASTLEDFTEIYAQIESVRNRAYVDGRPELLDEIYSAECAESCNLEGQREAIAGFKANGIRRVGSDPEVLRTEIVGRFDIFVEGSDVTATTLRVVTRQAPFEFVDPGGAVVLKEPGWEPTSRTFDMYFSPNKQRWVVVGMFVEGPESL